mgnify:CR=1 FL=1
MFPKTLSVILLFLTISHLFAEEQDISGGLKLKPHPRLWVSQEDLDRLRGEMDSPILKEKIAVVIQDAEWAATANLIQENEVPSYQAGTRAIASRLKNLTMAWVLTGESRYRKAAMANLKNMMNWNQVSCEARRGMPHDPLMYFCLSAGEHSADIALMYDLFYQDITAEEKQVFVDVLKRFYLTASLRAKSSPPWWANKEWSNWNGVCSGGIGQLALAFYDDLPEARALIPFVEESLAQYFKSYITNGGGNHEGTGYWNYGMHYAIRYLLSWEQATGKRHPSFDIPEIRKSLDFPVDFTGISFGDNDGWHPGGFFFKMAERTGNVDAAKRAAVFVYRKVARNPKPKVHLSACSAPDYLYAIRSIPSQGSMEELREVRSKTRLPLARVYDGLGWGILGDDSIFPKLRLAVRGGSNEVRGHGHIDVMSFKLAIHGKRLIEDQRGGGYTPVTFTDRGHHVYSRSAVAKSGLFVHGLSPMEDGKTRSTSVLSGDDWKAIRLDGTGIYLPRWRRSFIGRLFMMIDQSYFIIIDASRAGSGHNKGLESRFHTYGQLEVEKNKAVFSRGGEKVTATFASLGRGRLFRSTGTPEHFGRPTKILRWLGNSDLQVTVLNPGEENLDVDLKKIKAGVSIFVSGNQLRREIHVNSLLQVLHSEKFDLKRVEVELPAP